MKKLLILLLSVISLSVVAQKEVKKVAILETVDRYGNVPYGVLLQVRSSLTFAISNTEGYEGFDRVDISAITGEQNFQRTGHVDEEQIKRIGVMTGASYVLIAEAAQYDDQNIIITAKILDVETSGIIKSAPGIIESKEPAKMTNACIRISEFLLGDKRTLLSSVQNNTQREVPLIQTRVQSSPSVIQWAHYDNDQIVNYLIEKKYKDIEIDEQILQQINRKIQIILQQVGLEMRVKYIFDRKHLLYVDENKAVDVTPLIKDRL